MKTSKPTNNKPVVTTVVKPKACKGCCSYDSNELCSNCSIALTFKGSF